jgi:hypothetical protein
MVIPDEVLQTRSSREDYAKRIGASDTRYLEILAYLRMDPTLVKISDEEKIDRLELPWKSYEQLQQEKSSQICLPNW